MFFLLVFSLFSRFFVVASMFEQNCFDYQLLLLYNFNKLFSNSHCLGFIALFLESMCKLYIITEASFLNSSKHRTFSLNFNFFDHTMHKHKIYSLKKKAFWYWMRILIMFSILLLFLIFYISKQLQHETYQGIHQTMDLYVQQLNKSMETAENCLWEFANNNTDVVDTITSKNNPNAVISQIKASRL